MIMYLLQISTLINKKKINSNTVLLNYTWERPSICCAFPVKNMTINILHNERSWYIKKYTDNYNVKLHIRILRQRIQLYCWNLLYVPNMNHASSQPLQYLTACTRVT